MVPRLFANLVPATWSRDDGEILMYQSYIVALSYRLICRFSLDSDRYDGHNRRKHPNFPNSYVRFVNMRPYYVYYRIFIFLLSLLLN
jgi:hypothetical protein